MGIRQRREREKSEVRQSILTAAREIALQEGWQAVTIRKVAERIEYSPAALYEYFASKDAILTALLREGFRRLLVALQTAIASATEPETRLMRLIDGYWDFAWRNPELYQVMHGLDGVDFACFDSPIESEEVFMTVRNELEAWATHNGTTIANMEDCVDILWGMAHGLVSLTLANRVWEGAERTKALMRQGVLALLQAWRVNGQ